MVQYQKCSSTCRWCVEKTTADFCGPYVTALPPDHQGGKGSSRGATKIFHYLFNPPSTTQTCTGRFGSLWGKKKPKNHQQHALLHGAKLYLNKGELISIEMAEAKICAELFPNEIYFTQWQVISPSIWSFRDYLCEACGNTFMQCYLVHTHKKIL